MGHEKLNVLADVYVPGVFLLNNNLNFCGFIIVIIQFLLAIAALIKINIILLKV